MKYLLTLIVGLFLYAGTVQAQEEQGEDIYALSLEELMSMEIVSASKKSEDVFDAPISSYTITRREILNSGALTIMEALRLSPGVIVREQNNGNYDIHIRGFDNVMRYTDGFAQNSLVTLVMIDGRPVFNPNLGGTYWETLPIDVRDVERIEIVRGPSAALFGPNAVTGVINIITRGNGDKDKFIRGDVQYGIPNTVIANVATGITAGESTDLMVSANYQQRKNFTDQYFDKATGMMVNGIENVDGGEAAPYFGDAEVSLEKFGINLFAKHTFSETANIGLEGGLQTDKAQKIYFDNAFTYPTPTEANSYYLNFHGEANNFSARASYLKGFNNINLASTDIVTKYDYYTFDAVAEYDWTISEALSVRPGINFQKAEFDDLPYVGPTSPGFLNGSPSIETIAAFVRVEYNPLEKLRLVGALRADKFSAPDDVYFSWQLAATYKIGESLVRAAYSRSNSGSFIGQTYLNLPGVLAVDLVGNQNLDLFTVNNFEVGFRSNLSTNVQLDVEAFFQNADNFSYLVFDGSEIKYDNLSTTAKQMGVTVSMNIVPNTAFQIKPYVTFQKTDVSNIIVDPNYVISSTAYIFGAPTVDDENASTPAVYGGFYANYALKKFNFGFNGYYFTSQEQHNIYDFSAANPLGQIDGKFILNAKALYHITSEIDVFLNARNALNSSSREFYAGDEVGGLYLLGLSVNL